MQNGMMFLVLIQEISPEKIKKILGYTVHSTHGTKKKLKKSMGIHRRICYEWKDSRHVVFLILVFQKGKNP